MVLYSVKHGPKLSKTQSYGRVNLLDLNIPVWDPDSRVCSATPRFSYGMLKTVICTCPGCTREVVQPCGAGVYGSGMVPGTGIRVGVWEGYTGYYPATKVQLLEEQTHPAKRAPEAQGAGVGGVGAADVLDRPTCASVHMTTHSGPAGLRGPLRCHMASLRAKGEIS